MKRWQDEDREWHRSVQRRLLVGTVVWLAGSGILAWVAFQMAVR